MNHRKRKYITVLRGLSFLLISWCFAITAVAQDAKQLIAFAKAQKVAGNYSIAVKALDRVLYFDNDILFPEALPLLAECYYYSGDFSSARNCFDLAANRTENDSLRTEYAFMKLLCDLNTENYEEAKFELLTIDGNLYPHQQKNYELLFGIVSFHLEEYEESKKHFVSYSDSSNLVAINDFFNDVDKTSRRYKPGVARVLSIIFPGTGQLYAGDYRNGLNSILLTGGLALTGVWLSAYISFIDSAIIVLPWIQRYYTGGFQRAYYITLNKQKEEKKKLLVSFLDHLN